MSDETRRSTAWQAALTTLQEVAPPFIPAGAHAMTVVIEYPPGDPGSLHELEIEVRECVTVQPYGDFSGKVVIVTGAGSGIGRTTARAFVRAGARVLGVGRREDALTETATGHPEIVAYSADVCAPDAPGRVIDAAAGRWGRLDVLVNSAGRRAGGRPIRSRGGAGTGHHRDAGVTAPDVDLTLVDAKAMPCY
jgi:hypothetical protein